MIKALLEFSCNPDIRIPPRAYTRTLEQIVKLERKDLVALRTSAFQGLLGFILCPNIYFDCDRYPLIVSIVTDLCCDQVIPIRTVEQVLAYLYAAMGQQYSHGSVMDVITQIFAARKGELSFRAQLRLSSCMTSGLTPAKDNSEVYRQQMLSSIQL